MLSGPGRQWVWREGEVEKNREAAFVALFWVMIVHWRAWILSYRSVVFSLFLATETFCFHIKYYPEVSCMNQRRAGPLWSKQK